MTEELRFDGEDYHRLFDFLIEVNRADRSHRPSIVLNGKSITLFKAAELISKHLGHQEMLPHHQEAIDALFKKRQYRYGRTAWNLAHRVQAGPTPAMIAMQTAVKTHMARHAEAVRDGFKDYDEKLLAVAAFQAHPSWQEAEGETLIAHGLVLRKIAEKTWQELDTPALSVNGRVFLKVRKSGSDTITGVVKWFQKNHAEEAAKVFQDVAA